MKIRLNLKPNPREELKPLNQSKGPNLLQSVLYTSTESKEKPPVLKFPVFVIVAIQITFMLTVLYTTRLAFQIGTLKKNIDMKIVELDTKAENEKAVQNVLENINRIKSLDSANGKLKPNVDLMLNNLPQNIILERSEISRSKFSLSIVTDSAIEVSLLIDSYLKKNLGREIVIRSASLDTYSRKFSTTLEIVL